jgi:hypothetical protein
LRRIDDRRASSVEEWLAHRHEYIRGQEVEPEVEDWYLQFVTVGRDPDEIGGILLGVSGPHRGQVDIFDYSVGFAREVPITHPPYANSFAEFLSTLPGYRQTPTTALI